MIAKKQRALDKLYRLSNICSDIGKNIPQLNLENLVELFKRDKTLLELLNSNLDEKDEIITSKLCSYLK